MTELLFEWDAGKARTNELRHGVTFSEAETVFGDRFAITVFDASHSTAGEDRYVIVGSSVKARILAVAHCDRKNRVRIISARPATPTERRVYEENLKRMR